MSTGDKESPEVASGVAGGGAPGGASAAFKHLRGWRAAEAAAPFALALLLALSSRYALFEFGLMAVLGLLAAGVAAAITAVHPLVPFGCYFGALFFADTNLPVLGISANQVLAAAFFGSFISYWARGHTLRLESRFLPLLLIVAVYFGLRAVLGESPERGPTHAKYVLIYFGLAVCLAKSLPKERALLAVGWIVVGLTVLAALDGLREGIEKGALGSFTGNWQRAVRIRGTAPNSIVFAWNMVYAVPFAFLLYSQVRSAALRACAMAGAFFAIAAAALTFNRQTYILIALVVALAAWLFRYRNRRALLFAVAVLGAIGAATVLPLMIQRLFTVAELGRDLSYLERRDSAIVGVQMFKEHPLFGVGLGSFPAVYKNYIPSDYPTYFMQYYEPNRLRYPDFGYLGLLAETGIVGEALFVLLLGTVVWRSWRLRRLALARADMLVANYCSMLIVLVAFIAATSAVQDTFLYVRVWIVWGLALLLDERILLPERAADESEAHEQVLAAG